MKIEILVTLFILVMQSLGAQDWQLVWSDEFDGTSLNSDYWTRETGGNGWGNNELQYYTNRDTNAFVQDGLLTIRALQESYSGRDYTSARLITRDKVSYQYGRVEARIRLPYGQGLWPAFWMMGENFLSDGWPACGEIDIMELIGGPGRDNTTYGAAHWEYNGGPAELLGQISIYSGIFADDFHIFAVEWDNMSLRWFMDDQQFHSMDITPEQMSEFHNDFFILLNIAVGGNWPGSPDESTVFPQVMEVDYVRIYRDANLAPIVNITAPGNGEDFASGTELTIAAEASDDDGSIEKVQFFHEGGVLGEDTSEPYHLHLPNIQPGNYTIKALAVDNQGRKSFSESISFSVGSGAEQSPYLISPVNIPGVVQAENFDMGGEEISYHDTGSNNQGYVYRCDDGVDIYEMQYEPGYSVGWISDGEWLEYTVYVENSGEYLLETWVAAPHSEGYLYLQMDGAYITGYTSVIETGGFQYWNRINSNVILTEGLHVFRFNAYVGGFNLDKFVFSLLAAINDESYIKPQSFRLKQNFPNPFNPSTVIRYQLPENSDVTLTIYNSMGQEITSLVAAKQAAGSYEVRWNAENYSAGIYFYQLKAGSYTEIKKMVLIK